MRIRVGCGNRIALRCRTVYFLFTVRQHPSRQVGVPKKLRQPARHLSFRFTPVAGAFSLVRDARAWGGALRPRGYGSNSRPYPPARLPGRTPLATGPTSLTPRSSKSQYLCSAREFPHIKRLKKFGNIRRET